MEARRKVGLGPLFYGLVVADTPKLARAAARPLLAAAGEHRAAGAGHARTYVDRTNGLERNERTNAAPARSYWLALGSACMGGVGLAAEVGGWVCRWERASWRRLVTGQLCVPRDDPFGLSVLFSIQLILYTRIYRRL